MASRPATLDQIAADLAALARRVDGMEEDRKDDGALVQQIAGKLGVTTMAVSDEDGQNRDAPVQCPKCGSKVGYYDRDTDLVRTRHREHLVWMRMGPGGSIVIICRKCSHPVEVTYSPPDDTARAEIRDGLLVFSVDELSDLLGRAMDSGSGQVTLRVG
jgi:DNA-directed RNA polymerase subunit RPC12/RpoP